METIEAIHSRRTIRRFSDKQIPGEVLGQIIEAGFKAPSNDHLRKWEIVVVRDMNTKNDLVGGIKDKRTPDDALRIVSASGMSDEDQKNMYLDAIPLQYRMLVSSSVLVLPFFFQPKDVLRPAELSGLNCFASIWCFVENMLIAASSHGIYGVTRIPTEAERSHVKERVNAPAGYDFPCYLSLGYESEATNPVRQKRIDYKDHIHLDRW
jgi:nitroreductase